MRLSGVFCGHIRNDLFCCGTVKYERAQCVVHHAPAAKGRQRKRICAVSGKHITAVVGKGAHTQSCGNLRKRCKKYAVFHLRGVRKFCRCTVCRIAAVSCFEGYGMIA